MSTAAARRPGLGVHAEEAAARGWYVFPVRPGDKRPACGGWEQRASTDLALVRRHWPSPRHNAGIACGPSGLVVVDCDPPDGIEAFALLCRNHGHRPRTYTVRTPRDGLHLYYTAIAGREIRNSAGRVGPNIDVRGAGGYVVAAGSVVGGQAYEVADSRDPAPLPSWLADLAAPPRPRPAHAASPPSHPDRYAEAALRGEVERILTAPRGHRNDQLNASAYSLGQLVGAGILDCAEAVATLARAAADCGLVAEDGLPACERTIDSGLTAGRAQPRGRG